MAWWNKSRQILVGFVTIGLVLFGLNNSAMAVGPNNLECVDVDGHVICPDLYCTTGTITCDPDIKQCYCQPSVLNAAETESNAYCELATGSEIMFEKDSKGGVTRIILRKGIWGAIAKQLGRIYGSKSSGADENNYNINTEKGELYFLPQDGDKNDTTRYYSSNFLNLLRNDGWKALEKDFKDFYGYDPELNVWGLLFGQLGGWTEKDTTPDILRTAGSIGVGFYANIEEGSDSGFIYNQTFEVTYGENRQACGAHVLEDGQTFFQKSTGLGDVDNVSKTACVGVPDLLVKLILPVNNKNNSVKAGSIEKGLLARAQLTRTCVGFQVKEGVLFAGNTATELNDPFALAGELIVPFGVQRPVYQTYVENQYMGKIFGADEDKEDRRGKVDEVVKKCQVCQDLIGAGQVAPPYCDLCSGEVTSQLRDNPSKPYSSIVATELKNNNCQVITPSFGNISDNYYTPSHNSNTAKPSNSNRTEAELNKSLPGSITKICETEFGNNEQSRLSCKANGLQCYIERISPNLKGKDICAFMDKKESLRRGRWIFCPVLKTEVKAADSVQELIKELFNISPNLFSDTRITSLWQNFRDIANIVLVIIFLILIISQVTGLGLSNYQIKTYLPKVLVSALLVNLSFIVVQVGVEISNILGDGIAGLINGIAQKITNADASNFEALVFKSSGSVLIMAGILALALPVLLVVVISIITLLVILSLRKVLLVLLIVIAPLAFAGLGAPGLEKLVKSWWKTFIGILALYPIVQMVYASAQLTRLLMSGVSTSASGTATLMKIVAATLPYVAIVTIPFIVKSLFSSMSKLTASLTSGISSIGGMAKTRASIHAKNSYARQSINTHIGKSIGNVMTGDTARRRRKGKGRLLGNQNTKTSQMLNFISYGAGRNLSNQRRSAEQTSINSMMGLVGDDVVLLKALMHDQGKRGALYKNLNRAQQNQYDLIINQTHGLRHFNAAAPVLLAKNGITDQKLYQKAMDNAADSGVSKNVFIGLTYGTAKNAGDVEVMGIVKSHMTIKSRTIIASNIISSASKRLEITATLRRHIIENGGNLGLGLLMSSTKLRNKVVPRKIDQDILSEISTLSKRDLLTAAIDAESSVKDFDRDLITDGLTRLATDSPHYVVNAGGEMVAEADEEKSHVNYVASALELVNQNLADNGEKGQPPIKVDDLKIRIENNTKKLFANNNKTAPPENWSEDRSENRPPTKYDFDITYNKEITAVPFDMYYSKLLDETRTSDRMIGSTTTHNALEKIVEKLKDPSNFADLSDPVTEFYNKRLGTSTPKNNNVTKHEMFSFGRNWNHMPPSLQTKLAVPIVEHIFGSMEKSLNQELKRKHSERRDPNPFVSLADMGPAYRENLMFAIFGVRNMDDAENLGPIGMFRLIGIEPDEVER